MYIHMICKYDLADGDDDDDVLLLVGFGFKYGFANSETFHLEVFSWPDIVLSSSEIGPELSRSVLVNW